VEKDKLLIEDTLAFGKLTACKHANGRDWWILVRKDERFSRDVYRLLLSPQGVFNLGKQNAGPDILYSQGAVGNVVFSPDGTKYVSHEIRFNPLNAIDIYDFDRCTGELEHLEHFTMDDSIFLDGGASISPDSRYLYIVTQNIIYQFDLWASDIEATKTVVAEYDGFIGYPYASKFGIPQIGPNGKIYIASAATDTFMHVINTPNQPGLGSHVAQHSIGLSNLNDKSIPNFPNYRLGPLDGSPCDTLGLNNHPLAGFTWFAEELEVTFSDNSYYRPEEWLWEFGDGNGSSERNPIHAYALPGEYYVCLTVSNEYDSDTFCRWVAVDSVTTASVQVHLPKMMVQVWPNPAREEINIALPSPLPTPAEWWLYNTVGQIVHRSVIPTGQREQSLSLAGVPPGLYFWQVRVEGRQVGSGKVVVVSR
jgi:PKD domain-containing protein/type IX secretion system substrate protein